MFRALTAGILCSLTSVLVGGLPEEEIIIARGDANSSGSVDTADGIFINAWLFNGGPEPPCKNQADVNSDGEITIVDSSHLFNWLFLGGAAPPYPGPNNTSCTTDPAPYVGCAEPQCP